MYQTGDVWLLLFLLLRPQHLEWPASISLQSAVSTSVLSYLNLKTYLFGNTITNPSCCPFNPTPYLCILLCSWIANRCIFICMLCLFVLDCDGYITRSLSHWPWSPWSLVKCIDLATMWGNELKIWVNNITLLSRYIPTKGSNLISQMSRGRLVQGCLCFWCLSMDGDFWGHESWMQEAVLVHLNSSVFSCHLKFAFKIQKHCKPE